MNINNLDEAEDLIRKYRAVMSAKSEIDEVLGEDGGSTVNFALVEEATNMEIHLPDLKVDVMSAIQSVLNDQQDKIVSRIKEI